MSQTPNLAVNITPVMPRTASSTGYDNFTSGLTAGDVQAAIDEIQAEIAALPGTLDFLTTKYGEQATLVVVTASGAAYTIDCSAGNTFYIVVTANLTLSISNPAPSGVDSHIVVVLVQGGSGSYTVTWPASVKWRASDGTNTGSAPTLFTAVGAQDVIELTTIDGGTTWGGDPGAAQFTLTVKDEGTPLATGATSLDFVGSGVVASGTGAAKTITISGAPTGTAGGDLQGTYPNPTLVPASVAALVGSEHVHVAYETHTSDGSTVTFTLDQVYEAGSVMAWNRTAGTLLGVTEVLPDQATVSAAGTAADLIDFHYAASVI